MSTNCQVRRATVDDLTPLRRLWQKNGHNLQELEKRLTEFQIAETPEGDLLGSIGLRIEARQGLIHTEVYYDADMAGEIRPRLWDRALNVARNHGLLRLWRQPSGDAFWLEAGFEAVNPQAAPSLPPGFVQAQLADAQSQPWWCLKLRDDSSGNLDLEQELKLFQESQRQTKMRLFRQTRSLRVAALVVSVIVFLLAALAMVFVVRHLK